jgi:hypothetical protein
MLINMNSSRFLPLFGVLATLATLPVRAAGPIPRTADGHPDLQGIWTNVTLTPMERPAVFAGKLNVTDAEAAVYEKQNNDELKAADGKADADFHRRAGSGETGGYNALFIDRGSELARVDGVKRTSLIIDPTDGKMPPLLPEARQRLQAMRRGGLDSVKDRPLSERCLMSFGSSSGPPMLPVLYNNNYEIVQTPDAVVILVEMIHDARIIRMNAKHAPEDVRQWLGDSVGHWEGDTLVVDTTNFNEQVSFRGASKNLHVVERFSRPDGKTLLYRATIEDPTTFTKSFTIEYPFVATAGPIYEYACHEGNYSIVDILGGARKADGEGKPQ